MALSAEAYMTYCSMSKVAQNGLLVLVMAGLFSCSQPKQGLNYLENALAVEQWLAQNTQGQSLVWPDAMDDPDKISINLSDGMSAKLVYYLELYEATDEPAYLDRAKGIGDYLLENLLTTSDSLKGKFWMFSPYGNVCGPGYALQELHKVTNEDKYRKGLDHTMELLRHFADQSPDSVSWDLGNDVLGGLSGTGLFLLYAAEETQDPEYLQWAEGAANTLIHRSIQGDGTLTWKRGQDSRYILPNFSHGGAGIGYFFARLYEETGDQIYIQTALQAVNYLDSIAKTENDAYLIPYGFPDPGWSRAYDIGWAHGPAGVGRLFIKLHQLTNDPQWLRKAEACLKGIQSSNPLGQPAEGFGELPFSPDQRFGLAGVAQYAQDLYGLTKNPEHLDFATQIVNHLLAQADATEGLSWPIPRFRFMANGGDTTTFTGYFYGSTGFGTVLLNQYYLLNEERRKIHFVDDPF